MSLGASVCSNTDVGVPGQHGASSVAPAALTKQDVLLSEDILVNSSLLLLLVGHLF